MIINKQRFLGVLGVLALFAAALLIPAGASAAEDCVDIDSDPTAAQYCPEEEDPRQSEGESQTGGERETAGVEDVGATSPRAVGGSPGGGDGEPSSEVAAASASSDGGFLPFTGAEMLGLGAVAVVLLALGLAVRRLGAMRGNTAEPR